MIHIVRVANTCILICMLLSCATNRNSDVYYDYDYGYHTVLVGDTLYSIAWRHGIDYKKLAAWNNIRPPYTIYAGQRIRLAQSQVTSETYTRKSSHKTSSAQSAKKKSKVIVKNKKVSKPIKHDWSWPTIGKVISTYSTKAGGNKGIDIEGKVGQDVLAASAGKVVYSGNGLLGYGNLIIVKHSEQYLSAYAHNKKLFVKEGSSVKRGQKIAELGSTGTKSPKLHFEIRQNGKPVDPLKFLPKN